MLDFLIGILPAMFDFLIGILGAIVIFALLSIVVFLLVSNLKNSVQQGGAGRQNSHNVNPGTQPATQSPTNTTSRHRLEWRKLLKVIGWIVLVGFVIVLAMIGLPYLQNLWSETPSPNFGSYLPEWIGGVASISPAIWIMVAIAILTLLIFKRARSKGPIFFVLALGALIFGWNCPNKEVQAYFRFLPYWFYYNDVGQSNETTVILWGPKAWSSKLRTDGKSYRVLGLYPVGVEYDALYIIDKNGKDGWQKYGDPYPLKNSGKWVYIVKAPESGLQVFKLVNTP